MFLSTGRRVEECVNKCGIRIRLEQWNIVRARHLAQECIMRPVDCPYECGASVRRGCSCGGVCLQRGCSTVPQNCTGAVSTLACSQGYVVSAASGAGCACVRSASFGETLSCSLTQVPCLLGCGIVFVGGADRVAEMAVCPHAHWCTVCARIAALMPCLLMRWVSLRSGNIRLRTVQCGLLHAISKGVKQICTQRCE
jgi:hypothetical protein